MDVHDSRSIESRQILLPLKLAAKRIRRGRRHGRHGLGSANLGVQNKPFPKGKSEDTLRLFVQRTSAPRYLLDLLEAAVRLVPSEPGSLERAVREQAAAVKAADEAAGKAKLAVAERDRTTKKKAEAIAQLNSLRTRLSKLQTDRAVAERTAKSAADEKARLEVPTFEPAALADATARVADFAQKSADEAAAAVKSASAAITNRSCRPRPPPQPAWRTSCVATRRKQPPQPTYRESRL